MLRKEKSSSKGFTLLELMTVVMIIGVLAAIAIPLLSNYLKKSKTTEASLNLRKIYDGEVAYFSEDHLDQNGTVLTSYFIEAAATPAYPPGVDKRTGNFEVVEWKSLKFGTDSPVLYVYSTITSGSDITSAFTARAEGDIDGDGSTSLFERVASVDSGSGEVSGGSAIYELDPLE